MQNSEPVIINQLITNPNKRRDTYRYPEFDENAKLNGLIKKDKIFKKCINRTRKRTQAELELVQNVHNVIK